MLVVHGRQESGTLLNLIILIVKLTGFDQRAINQFFISANWDAYVESLGDIERLHSLVSLPTADDQYVKV
jgi:hypothetical protein